MKVRFYIEKRKDEGGKLLLKDRPVFMSVSFPGHRVMIGTGIKSDFNGWDPELQRVRVSYPGSHAFNAWLDTLSETAHTTWKALHNGQEKPDSEQYRKLFNDLKPEFSSGFFDVFYQFMETGSNRWKMATYRKVRTIYDHLREFEDVTGFTIAFNNLDDIFLEKFITYYSEKGNRKTTTYKAVNILVWFLNWATHKGYNVYREYRKFYRSMDQPKETSGYLLFLRWDELMKLYGFSFGNRRMERVRDLFCFMCFSGLRYSELQALKKEDVGVEDIIVKKNKGNVRRLPLNKFAKEIHGAYENKYYLNNTAFPSMSIITMNKYLKLIAKEAGLDRVVSAVTEDEAKVPLFDRLTAGIAVHTFIANAIELEVPVEIISSFTGVQNDSRVRRIKMDLANKEMKKFDQK